MGCKGKKATRVIVGRGGIVFTFFISSHLGWKDLVFQNTDEYSNLIGPEALINLLIVSIVTVDPQELVRWTHPIFYFILNFLKTLYF